MIRIVQKQRLSQPGNASSIRKEGRSVYAIPVCNLVRREREEEGLQARSHILGRVEDQAIDVRVDWDGSASSTGSFEVLVDLDVWQGCEHIDPGIVNDVVSPATEVAGQAFLARFQRGPKYRSYPFGLKAIPIVWVRALPDTIDPDHVAVRDEDYVYADGASPELIPWTYSVSSNGVQALTVELSMGRDYEVWVRLQDPQDATNWRVQDPIVRTGGGGGNTY